MGTCCNAEKDDNSVNMMNSIFRNNNDELYTTRTNYNTLKSYNNIINEKLINDDEFRDIRIKLYELFTSIRTNPKKYLKRSKESSLEDTFSNLKGGNIIKFSDEKYIEIKNYLFGNLSYDKPNDEKDVAIFEILGINQEKNKAFRGIGMTEGNKIEDSIWSMFENFPDELENIIDNDYQHLLIVCQPLGIESQMIVSFIFYNK